jgi:hypothetical protein
MKKISLATLFSISLFFAGYAQQGHNDTTHYKKRPLKLEEVNFVSSYYNQDGNNSAVTGGIGTEKLVDFANILDLVYVKEGRNNSQLNLTLEMGIDHYTSASSDKIDPATISSASSHDTRYYPSITLSKKDNKGNNFGLGLSFSKEFDYLSYGVGGNYSRTSKDNNREFSVHLQSYFDRWTVIYPIELRPPGGGYSGHGGSRKDNVPNTYKPRDSYSSSFSYAWTINKRFQMMALLDLIYQTGLLATDYQRVYFTNNTERIENLPDNRFKFPIGLRANYFWGDRVILRAYYRYYIDDWGIKAHTASLEVPVKITPFLSISPFYRYYSQSQALYFAPYAMHAGADIYYTSDYDLSQLQSHFFGLGFRFTPQNGVLNIKHFSSLEIRYGHYLRSTGLFSDIISLNANFK